MMNRMTLYIVVVIIAILLVLAYKAYKTPDDSNIDWDSLEVAPGKDTASALLVTCIDFRFIDKIIQFMKKSGYFNDYDIYTMAGASLGANQDRYPDWAPTFWKHVDLALKLHEIKKIIIVDHQDCGTYKLIYPDMYSKNEFKYHKENLLELSNKIKELYPKMKVEGYFIRVNKKIQRVI